MLIKLQAPRKIKVVLAALFSFSGCTVVISALRIWAQTLVSKGADGTWDAVPSTSVLIVELNMTVICASLIVLRPFCRRHLPFLFGSQRTSNTLPDTSDGRNFDGPSGPRSKNNYRTKFRGGGSKDTGKTGKRGVWTALGSTRGRHDDEGMEDLSNEFNSVALHGHTSADRHISRNNGQGIDPEIIGVAHSDRNDSRERDLENRIVKTVSLDIR
ncbi:MAG: hypothetical protein Q9221_003299 [Calogaya cf. arnoldii]